MPNLLVPIVLALFVPATYVAMRKLGPRSGAMVALLGGWLFLPVFDGRLDIPVLAGKMTFVSTIVLLVSLVADPASWSRLELHWVDLFAATVGLSPFATALSNDLGAYEGLSAATQSSCAWIAPYLLGRVYLGTPRAIGEFARRLVGGALVYVPLCLWEVRMSPQLHRQLYGYATFESFAFAVRFGGYRPIVFMHFGLMVGTFMATGTLIAYWLWRSGTVTRLGRLPAGSCTLLLAATTVLVKSTGAIILLVVGIAVLEAAHAIRRPWPILLLTLVPLAFGAARICGWDAAEIVSGAKLISVERAQSVGFRIANEQLLIEKALQRPLLGWGRFGRSRIYDEDGRDISVTDSYWVILLGTVGLVGLISMAVLLLTPTLLLLRRFPARSWKRPFVAPAAALTISVVLWVVDCLLNAMTTPLFPAMCGATLTFLVGRWPARRRAALGGRSRVARAAGAGGATVNNL